MTVAPGKKSKNQQTQGYVYSGLQSIFHLDSNPRVSNSNSCQISRLNSIPRLKKIYEFGCIDYLSCFISIHILFTIIFQKSFCKKNIVAMTVTSDIGNRSSEVSFISISCEVTTFLFYLIVQKSFGLIAITKSIIKFFCYFAMTEDHLIFCYKVWIS